MSRINVLNLRLFLVNHKSQSNMSPARIEKSDFDAEALTTTYPVSVFHGLSDESPPPKSLACRAATRCWRASDTFCRRTHVTVKDLHLVERAPELELDSNTHQALTSPPRPPARQQKCIG